MEYYLSKYVGTYRIMAEIDQKTNDFCRDKRGIYCNDNDIYIKCTSGAKIWHYGKDVLQVYIPSKRKGENLIKTFTKDGVINLIYDIEFTDLETLFKVKDDDLKRIINYLKPQTNGAKITPFSSRNLKKDNKSKIRYITDEQEEILSGVFSELSNEEKILIIKFNKKFIDDILCNKLNTTSKKITEEIKSMNTKQADYFYFKGYWNEYIEFVKKEINKAHGKDFNQIS